MVQQWFGCIEYPSKSLNRYTLMLNAVVHLLTFKHFSCPLFHLKLKWEHDVISGAFALKMNEVISVQPWHLYNTNRLTDW